MIRKYSNMTGTTNRSSTRAHNFCSFFEMIVRIEKRIALHIPEILYLNFLLALNLPIGRTECLGRCVMDLLLDLHIQLIPERPPREISTSENIWMNTRDLSVLSFKTATKTNLRLWIFHQASLVCCAPASTPCAMKHVTGVSNGFKLSISTKRHGRTIVMVVTFDLVSLDRLKWPGNSW